MEIIERTGFTLNEIRVAVHVHSDWSYDGVWPLSKLVSYFRRVGCHCILTAEHDKTFNENRWLSYREACIKNSSDDFLILPGIEYSDPLNKVHVMVWGNIPFLGVGRDTGALLQDVNKYQGIAVMAHPSRKQAWEEYKSYWSECLIGIEMWNRKADGVAPSRDAISLLKQNAGLLPFVGLDFHRANQLFPLYMTVKHEGIFNEADILSYMRNKEIRSKVVGVSAEYFSQGAVNRIVGKIEDFRQYLRKIL